MTPLMFQFIGFELALASLIPLTLIIGRAMVALVEMIDNWIEHWSF